jgi:hypothetical protein
LLSSTLPLLSCPLFSLVIFPRHSRAHL